MAGPWAGASAGGRVVKWAVLKAALWVAMRVGQWAATKGGLSVGQRVG